MPMWQIAIRRLEMPISRFIAVYVGGAFAAGLLASLLLIFLTGGFAEGALFSGFSGVLLLLLLPVLAAGGAMAFPLLEVNRSANLIEREMHMFITRMGILSLGEVGAQTIFDILKQMRDYGELASEVQRIETLVDKWHTSLPEAARIVAQQSPSPLWTDFLDRMAFSIEAGQPIDEFMRSEQETVAEQYNTLYDTRLESVDTMQEIYVSMVTAGLFGLVIAGIHLVLFEVGGENDTPIEVASRLRFLLLASMLFIIIQVAAMMAFRATIPRDLIFARDELDTPFRINFRRSILAAGSVSLILLLITILVIVSAWEEISSQWDRYGLILLAAPLSPMLIPAWLIGREEGNVQRRDGAYPDFIRALGGTAQARSAEPSATIKALRGVDFGMLDASIDRLERRLATRIDSDRAWDYFNADTNSAVISRYTRIYIEGSQSSGKPAETAEMVSRSVGNLLSLRRRRALSANTMWGVALGLLVASVTSLNVTISIVLQLGEAIAGVATGLASTDVGALQDFGSGIALPVMEDASSVEDNIRMFKIIVSILVIGQIIAVSAIATRLRGGGKTSAAGQAIQLLWVAGITSWVTAVLLEGASSFFGV
ncbi:MAG: type II secretion system F family protein [Candidatus Thermoplasmatota archaeon]|nr:type II secretion system F family protein [Candidatus Thermoplasmatota archaeon]MEC7253962.1 type II secretion system F family protein [Candidatus Thermoplasmatota archaeon]